MDVKSVEFQVTKEKLRRILVHCLNTEFLCDLIQAVLTD